MKISLTVSDTQSVVERVAARELELGIVGAARRHRAVRFEPFFDDEVILACPPGHAFAGRTVTLDELRAENLIVMQEGAGVRQIVEDELRALGTRLRDLDVRLELGLQESVRSAVQAGYGVTFISRSAVEPELGCGDADGGAGRGARREARDLARARVRPHEPRAPRTRSSSSRAAKLARGMIVRWGLERAPGARGGRARRSSSRAPLARRRSTPRDRWEEVPSHRIEVPDGVDTIVAVGGGSAIDTGKAASAASGPAARLGADDVLRRGVDGVLRRARPGPQDARRRRRARGSTAIVYEPSSRSSCRAPRRSARR